MFRAIQASRNQGDSYFQNNGKQCVANSVCALTTSKYVIPSKWTSSILNDILGKEFISECCYKQPILVHIQSWSVHVCCLHLQMVFRSCARGRQWCGIIHYYWWTASIKPRLLFSRVGYASWGISLSSV